MERGTAEDRFSSGAYRLRVSMVLGDVIDIGSAFKEWKSHAHLRAFSTAKPAIVEGLIVSAPRRLRAAFMQAIDYLASNAQRAHPHRDRRGEPLATGLKPVFRAA